MPEFTASIANCPIIGEEITRFDDGGWSRNLINLRLGRIRATLVQDRAIVSGNFSELIGRRLHTTELTLANVPAARSEWALRIAEDVSWLLAFATMSPVNVFHWKHGGHGRFWEAFGAVQHLRPVVDTLDGTAVRKLVETCWTSYRRLKRIRRLPEVIHYCVQTEEPGLPIEYKLLGTFVLLENLKATFARSRSIPYVAGSFKKPSPSSKNLRKAGTYKFEELLKMMFLGVGMKPSLRRLVKLRNEIVHFGLSRRSIARLLDYYERAHGLAREYLLRLLGFSGSYYSWSRPDGPMIKMRT